MGKGRSKIKRAMQGPKRRSGVAWAHALSKRKSGAHKDKREVKEEKILREEIEEDTNIDAYEESDPNDFESIWWES
jgi:hypothetical protein